MLKNRVFFEKRRNFIANLTVACGYLKAINTLNQINEIKNQIRGKYLPEKFE